MWQMMKRCLARGPQAIARKIPIAGLQYYRANELADCMRRGDTLDLVPESGNPYDPHAIMVLWHQNKIGYVPGEQARALHDLRCQMRDLKGRIVAISAERGQVPRLSFDIYRDRHLC
ncbi:MAG: HIRAN domain-containing protein [Cardiobacteriaceae bacterium]|nr:HIRAN domain-containing protein [Cardiobacteriaceae bacterium]